MRHQRHFAQAARAIVGVDQLLQHFLAARGVGLDDAAFLEATWMPSIIVPWCDSGLVAVTVPSARSLCGVVKTSSVGMLGMQ